ncbi:hypothetical protein [Mesorhizobium sp. B1-1-7]|uniref:hypothetical protein n=1 Tax=Mesorhizobium sp. B1-1-7 TaxID=2589977 RepID=UPI001126A51A|nr:hypothetical protein [Mesorhizobium sp. B1-1-7]TPN48558.1 hypothetical protein FJ978_19485 [Mesorhizobium sp. B1-1-7]
MLPTLKSLGSLVCCAVGVLFVTGPSFAESICDMVIAQRAFDVHSHGVKSGLTSNAADAVCSVRWSSNDDAKTQAAKWTSDADAFEGMFKGTGNGNWDTTSHSASENYDQICLRTDRSLLITYFSRNFDLIAEHAVNAWRDCVLAQSSQFGLFSTVQITPDRSNVTISVIYKPTGTDRLTIQGYDPDAGYSCSIDGRDARNIRVDNNAAQISCRPTNENDLNISLNTNTASFIGPFLVKSGKYLELEQALADARQQLADAQTDISILKSDLTAMPARIARSTDADQTWTSIFGPDPRFVAGHTCPDGQFVSGISFDIAAPATVVSSPFPEGKIRLFHRFRVDCRKLGQ